MAGAPAAAAGPGAPRSSPRTRSRVRHALIVGRGLPRHVGRARSRPSGVVPAGPARRGSRRGRRARAPGTPRPRSPRRRRSATGWRPTCCRCCRGRARRRARRCWSGWPCRRPTRGSCTATSGREHIRVVGDAVTGVIDWGDCGVGRPGPRPGVDEVRRRSRRSRPRSRRRTPPTTSCSPAAVDWHLLGPWHEVLYGLDTDQPGTSRAASPAPSPASGTPDHRRVVT